jgi:Temperature dependent protein affecting M2 dsRNA replication
MTDPNCRQITPPQDGSTILKSKSEILFNVMGRFLQLRGFLNEKHALTSWGRALAKALASADASDKLEDSVYLAFEMLRLGLIDDRNFVLGSTRSKVGEAETLSPVYIAMLLTHTLTDDVSSLKTLITKVACFGRLKHATIGYSGPLDREMLAFQFMISAVRTSLRDLLETILVTMCLNGEVDRNRSDWSDLAFRYIL